MDSHWSPFRSWCSVSSTGWKRGWASIWVCQNCGGHTSWQWLWSDNWLHPPRCNWKCSVLIFYDWKGHCDNHRQWSGGWTYVWCRLVCPEWAGSRITETSNCFIPNKWTSVKQSFLGLWYVWYWCLFVNSSSVDYWARNCCDKLWWWVLCIVVPIMNGCGSLSLGW